MKVKWLSKIIFLRGKNIFTFTPERVSEITKLECSFLSKACFSSNDKQSRRMRTLKFLPSLWVGKAVVYLSMEMAIHQAFNHHLIGFKHYRYYARYYDKWGNTVECYICSDRYQRGCVAKDFYICVKIIYIYVCVCLCVCIYIYIIFNMPAYDRYLLMMSFHSKSWGFRCKF